MIRPDKQPIRVYLFRNGNLSPGTKFYRLDEGRKFKVIVYIFLEYVIGCSIDLLYTGLNFAPYFQKECTYVIVASSSTCYGYNLPIIRNFGLVITIHVMICQKLLDACKCLECFIHVYIL